MIESYHVLIALVLALGLPVGSDLIVNLIKLANYSPVQNTVSAANSQSFKSYLREMFKNRMECSVGNYISHSLLFAANTLALSFIVSIIDISKTAVPPRTFYIFSVAFAFFSFALRAFAFLLAEKRLEFTNYISELAFSFLTLILLLACYSVDIEFPENALMPIFLFLASQPVLFILFFKKLSPGKRLPFIQQHAGVVTRFSLNLLLLGNLAYALKMELSQEATILAFSCAFIIEVLMRILSMETPRARSGFNIKAQKYFISLLCVMLAGRLLL